MGFWDFILLLKNEFETAMMALFISVVFKVGKLHRPSPQVFTFVQSIVIVGSSLDTSEFDAVTDSGGGLPMDAKV